MWDQDEQRQFFMECKENRELIKSMEIVIPVRPEDGLNAQLARILSVWYAEGINWANLNDHMGGFIEITRANILNHFAKKSDKDYLLMIDNDMEPSLRLPWLLLRHKLDMVGGCCMSVHPEYGPQLCFSRRDINGGWRFPSLRSSPTIPKKGLLEVGHVGTGALMISRKVAESFTFENGDVPFYVPEPVRVEGLQSGTLKVGEDIVFCNQAREKGFKVHVDLEAHVGHRKGMQLIWPEEKRSDDMNAEKWVLPEHGHLFSDGAID